MEENKLESGGSDGEKGQPWIDELSDEQLVNFSREFDVARPALPAAALERISGLVDAELSSVEVRRRTRGRAALGVFGAATTLAAVIIVVGFFRADKQRQPQKARTGSAEQERIVQPVQDQFVVEFVVLPHESEQHDALFPVEQYTSLTGGLNSPAE